MMDAIIFRYLIFLTILQGLDLRLMDVVITYLHGSLDNGIYMKILEGFQMLEATNSKFVAYTQLSYKDPCID